MAATAESYLFPSKGAKKPKIEASEKIIKDRGLEVDDVDLECIASYCNGYVGKDLRLLCFEAAMMAFGRMSDPLIPKDKTILSTSGLSNSDPENTVVKVKMEDFVEGKKKVLDSMTRGLAEVVPTVNWDDIGGLEDLKKELKLALVGIKKKVETSSSSGRPTIRRVLLYGPTGCGKSTLVHAAAHDAQASFFRLSGPLLSSMNKEEGVELIRRAFRVARLGSPSIIFLDDIDAVFPYCPDQWRGDFTTADELVSAEELFYVFITEMHSLQYAKEVIVFAATNRAVHDALYDMGCFDMKLYVPPPNEQERYEILKIKTKPMKLGEHVNLRDIAARTELLTSLNLEWICQYADGLFALSENATCINMDHFTYALSSVRRQLMMEDYDTTL